MENLSQADQNRLIAMPEIRTLSGGLSHTYIYKQVKAGALPPPVKIGRSSRWRYADVMTWLSSFKPAE